MPDSIIKADNISSLSGEGVGFPNGSVSNPSMKFTNDGDTGLYRPNSNELGFVTNGSEKLRIESTGQIKATYESTIGSDYNTTLHNGYFCRAWVNFNGTGTVSIRASGNVSSITDNETGHYTVNFTVAMPDINYSFVGSSGLGTVVGSNDIFTCTNFRNVPTVSSCDLASITGGRSLVDAPYISVGIFR